MEIDSTIIIYHLQLSSINGRYLHGGVRILLIARRVHRALRRLDAARRERVHGGRVAGARPKKALEPREVRTSWIFLRAKDGIVRYIYIYKWFLYGQHYGEIWKLLVKYGEVWQSLKLVDLSPVRMN